MNVKYQEDGACICIPSVVTLVGAWESERAREQTKCGVGLESRTMSIWIICNLGAAFRLRFNISVRTTRCRVY
jgi:hypothetical protein